MNPVDYLSVSLSVHTRWKSIKYINKLYLLHQSLWMLINIISIYTISTKLFTWLVFPVHLLCVLLYWMVGKINTYSTMQWLDNKQQYILKHNHTHNKLTGKYRRFQRRHTVLLCTETTTKLIVLCMIVVAVSEICFACSSVHRFSHMLMSISFIWTCIEKKIIHAVKRRHPTKNCVYLYLNRTKNERIPKRTIRLLCLRRANFSFNLHTHYNNL